MHIAKTTRHLALVSLVGALTLGGIALGIFEFTPITDATTSQAIGVRVMKNPLHLSAKEWYRRACDAGTFTDCGTPTPVTIGGYQGIRDGGTVYVHAANITSTELRSHIYIFSLSQGASADGQEIFRRFLDNVVFNDQASIRNRTDADALRARLQRDTIRRSDLQSIQEAIEAYKTRKRCSVRQDILCETDNDCPGSRTLVQGVQTGDYCGHWAPPIASGSFIRGVTFSHWPSWQATLGATLGMQLPVDPGNPSLNGRQGFSGCSGRFDSTTCWDQGALEMQCPARNGRQVYAYRAVKTNSSLPAADQYILGAYYEYRGANNWNATSVHGLGSLNAVINGGTNLSLDPICVNN